jgi:hypothetical protein
MLYDAWRASPMGTNQDLADASEKLEAQRLDSPGVDGDVWWFPDGSTIEILWNSPQVNVDDGGGRD